MDTIVFQCQRGECTHAVIVKMMGQFIISFGLWEPKSRLIQTKERMYLPLNEHPELQGLHDGHGWNLPALAELMEGMKTT